MKICQAQPKVSGPKMKNRIREDGFTLMEILIALSIFAVGILAVASMQMRAIQVNNKASNVTQSTTWAQSTMEELITLNWGNSRISDGTHTDEAAPDGSQVTVVVTDVDLGGTATAELKRITVRHTYLDGGITKTVSVTGTYPLVAAPGM